MDVPWVLATRSAGKLKELRALFAAHGIAVIDLVDAGVEERVAEEDAVEEFDSFEENALAKARYYSSRLPGRIVVADDSGLAVDALGGAPGVRSKRWSAVPGLEGEALVAANNARLVEELKGKVDSGAQFVCVAAWHDGTRSFIARGEVPGCIVADGRGKHGFGYDPHFLVDEIGLTLAEASLEEKERVSHRGRAFRRLIAEVGDADRSA